MRALHRNMMVSVPGEEAPPSCMVPPVSVTLPLITPVPWSVAPPLNWAAVGIKRSVHSDNSTACLKRLC